MPTLFWPIVLVLVGLQPLASSSEVLGLACGPWMSRDADAGPPAHGEIGRIGSARLRHGADVRSLAFSPNGGLLVSVDCQRTAIVWEVESGRIVRRWDLSARLCGPTGFSGDGGRVIWSLGDGYIRSHDLRTGAEVRASRHGSPKAIHSIPSAGHLVVVDPDDRLRSWDESTGRCGQRVEFDDRVTWSECGRFEATVASPSVLTCRDRSTGTTRELSPGEDRLHRLGCVRFSPDSRYIFASSFGGRILRFNRSTGQVVNRYGPLPASADCLTISSDGSCLAVAAGNRIHILDVATGVDRFPTRGEFARPPAMSLTADGRAVILSGGYPTPREEVWDLETLCRRSRAMIPRSAWEERMSPFPLVSPNGRVRVSFGGVGRGFSQFDTSILSFLDEDGKPLWSVKKGLPGREGYAFSADGDRVAVVEDNGLAVYESGTGRMVRDLPYVDPLARREWAHGVAFTPDRFAVITAHPTGLIYWPVGGVGPAREVRLRPGERLEGRESLLAVSPDGRLAVVGNDQFEVIVFELATMTERFRFSTRRHGPPASTLFAVGGRHLLVANGDGTVTIHDLAAGSGDLVRTAPQPDVAWDDLGSPDAAVAFRTMRQIADAPDLTRNWLGRRLGAAEPDRQIAVWVRQLDAARYPVREAAQRELAQLGHAARPALLAASRAELTAECRRRVEALLQGTLGPDLSQDGIRVARAIEVVERMGAPAADDLLRSCAAGPEGATQTEAARAALARRAGRP